MRYYYYPEKILICPLRKLKPKKIMKGSLRKDLCNLRCILPFAIFLLFSVTVRATPVFLDTAFSSALEGRWDMTINMEGKEAPSWLEVRHSGLHTLVGDFVGTGGSARPISKVNYANGKISFSIPPQWEEGSDLSVEGTLEGDNLSGNIIFPNGKS